VNTKLCLGRICEALGDNTVTDSIVVRLNITINNYPFLANFCIIENTSNYFDLLISLKAITENYLFIHPISKSLCRFNSLSTFEVITPLLEDKNMECIACFIKFIGKEKSINSLAFNNQLDNPLPLQQENFQILIRHKLVRHPKKI